MERHRFSQGLLAVLAICFALQVFSPIRVNTDAVVLLSVGESAAHGGGFFDSGQKTVFPPGYPALLAALVRVGLGRSWAIVGLNVLLLAVGLFAAYSLLLREFFEDKTVVLSTCSFFLLSFVVVKHVTIPLTDVPFFCCSMCSLVVAGQATRMEWNRRRVLSVCAAWALAVAAITVRRIGVALVPPLLFMMLSGPQSKSLAQRLSRGAKLTIAGAFLLAGVGTTYVVAKTSTLSDFIGAAQKSDLSSLSLQILSGRFTEFGELLANAPMSKLPAKLQVTLPWVGLLVFLLTLVGLATKRRRFGPTELYLVGYMGILFAWPYYDARFWLPVIPLLIAYSALAVKQLKFPLPLVAVYCMVFATLGFAAIAYSTRISFAGSGFADRYGDGGLRPTYCAAFRSCRDSGDPAKIDKKVLRLLREYR